MIVTLDGPAGAGKTSIARQLAKRLGFSFLDTGAMYRGVTLLCLQRQIDPRDEQKVLAIAKSLTFDFRDDKVFVDDRDVTGLIRTTEVTDAIKPVADNVAVRRHLVDLQRDWAGDRDVVTEGRDQGTVAFPNADCKIFLTASPEERARRRVAQLAAEGTEVDFETILKAQQRRDDDDINRLEGGLKAAADSNYVLTDGLTHDQVIDRLVILVKSKDRRLQRLF